MDLDHIVETYMLFFPSLVICIANNFCEKKSMAATSIGNF